MGLKHFIDTQDFSKQELLDLIDLIRMIKAADKQGATPRLLEGASWLCSSKNPLPARVSLLRLAWQNWVGKHYI